MLRKKRLHPFPDMNHYYCTHIVLRCMYTYMYTVCTKGEGYALSIVLCEAAVVMGLVASVVLVNTQTGADHIQMLRVTCFPIQRREG